MDFDFRDDEQQAADLARAILSDHATNERLKSLAAGGAPYDVDLWKALARAGLLVFPNREVHSSNQYM